MLDPDFDNYYRSAGKEVDGEGSVGLSLTTEAWGCMTEPQYINPFLINPTAAGWTPSTLSDARTMDPESDPITSAIMSGVEPPKMPTVRHKMTKEEKAGRKQWIAKQREEFPKLMQMEIEKYRRKIDWSDLMDRDPSLGQVSSSGTVPKLLLNVSRIGIYRHSTHRGQDRSLPI
jgi:hypothetical protein